MKAWLALVLLALLPVGALHAQESSADPEFRRFLAQYERAKVAGPDVDFLERALADEYVYTGPAASRSDRARTLAHFARKRGQPRDTRNALEHLNVTVRVVGNMALTTHDWVARTAPRGATGVQPKTDKGRYTGVFERRDGRWQALAEHDSIAVNDEPWMLAAVAQARRDYHAALLLRGGGRSRTRLDAAGESASLDRFLAEGYTYTAADGAIVLAQDAKAGPGDVRIRLASIDAVDTRLRAIDNGTVIENATLRVSGHKDGAPFSTVQRHTTTWAFHDGRWKIAADHASTVDAHAR